MRKSKLLSKIWSFCMKYKIYFITILISIILIVPAIVWENYTSLTILSGIGCSGLAAALMAIFLESSSEKKEKARKTGILFRYLSDLSESTKKVTGQLLWMSEHIEDDWFGWNDFSDKSFFMIKHHLYLNAKNQNYVEKVANKQASKNDAIKELNIFFNKYFEWGEYDKLSPEIKNRLHVIGQVVLDGNQNFIQEIIKLEKDRLYLDAEGILMLNDNKCLYKE